MRAAPIVRDDVLPEILGDLRIAILALEKACPSQPSLNQGGWKSKEILSWGSSCASQLCSVLTQHVADRLALASRGFSLHGWAMVNRPRDCHPRHIHRGALLSGVYCVDPGDEPIAPTVFEVDDGNDAGDVAVVPAPGRLILFPSDMWHRVDACGGSADRPRITIAFDARR